MTPLEFVQHPVPHDAGVLLLSASGANSDIIAAARHAVLAEYAPVVGLCARPGTPLRAQLKADRHTVVHEYSGPSVKDGFLATNSLLLTLTLLARAYRYEPPSTLPSLSATATNMVADRPGENAKLLRALSRRNLIVLANGWSTAAAYDLESKWGESGLASVTVTDARNFAHGRHYGLWRRVEESAVVGLATADDLGLNERTLAQLPPDACSVSVRSKLGGEAGALDLVAQVIRLAGVVGAAQGIDPGRPRVPAFGRTLYNAGIPRRALALSYPARGETSSITAGVTSSGRKPVGAIEDIWIRRKVTPAVWENAAADVREHWRLRCRAWVDAAEGMRIGGMVFDYDGTLCEADERLKTPAASIGAALARLVDQGLVVGVATGRGGSVLEALRAVLPKRLWSRVIIGMYNGGVICRLNDSPAATVPVIAIDTAFATLLRSPVVAAIANIRAQASQLTVHARQPLPDGVLHRFVVEALTGYVPLTCTPVARESQIADKPTGAATSDTGDRVSTGSGVNVLSSCHTVDVIAAEASKLRVIAAVREAIHAAASTANGLTGAAAKTLSSRRSGAAIRDSALAPAVMTIGDQGHLGGNDWSLLAQPLGLSVERVSSVFDTCWNVAPVGARRTAALQAYISALSPDGHGTFRWSVARAADQRLDVRQALVVVGRPHSMSSTQRRIVNAPSRGGGDDGGETRPPRIR